MGILKILFTILILSFPIAEIGRIQFSNGVAVSINDILLILVIISWGGYHLLNKKKTSFGKLTKPILLFAGIALFSLVLNMPWLGLDKSVISSLYLLRWIAYAIIYFVVLDFDLKFKNKLPYLLVASGTLIVAAGYIQYLLYPSLRNLYYLGWDEHLYRMFSTFLDPNFAGVFFVIFFFFIVNLAMDRLKKKQKLISIALLIVAIADFFAVYLTYSRSALLMLVLSLIVYLFLLGRRKIILIAIIAVVLTIFILPKSFQTEGTNFLRTVSSVERIKSVNQAVAIFQSSPLYGVGFNAYRYAQNKRGLDNAYWQITHSGAGTDNSFLFVLATAGVVGLASYSWILFSIVNLGVKNLKKNNYAIVLITVTAGLLIGSMFINSLFYVLILEWIWVLAGLTESSK